ncbi:hypothetical protein TRFO_10317 [Tritrichomonas foetus]|uniref:Uncharacterized protein n=1 Tax=Tritrichomonas foetus TaxID=1144522 RepID=A0A1J4JEN3_9EUKA|nr:hypothetical protein TRFO_10317 [Tritrichomonas foetus]|eukprot:OHS95901.1 hypothetical protein TRFO_10317 [Tritrichomonas foetus]
MSDSQEESVRNEIRNIIKNMVILRFNHEDSIQRSNLISQIDNQFRKIRETLDANECSPLLNSFASSARNEVDSIYIDFDNVKNQRPDGKFDTLENENFGKNALNDHRVGKDAIDGMDILLQNQNGIATSQANQREAFELIRNKNDKINSIATESRGIVDQIKKTPKKHLIEIGVTSIVLIIFLYFVFK